MAAAVSYMQADPAYRKDVAHAQSHVKHILRSPAHYLAAKKRKFAPTISMQIGSALHCLVLEGQEQFDSDYVLKPEGLLMTTKAGKEWKEQNEKKTVLSRTDQYASWDAVHGMTDSLRTLEWFNPDQKDYRKFNEVSLYWDQDGLNCKCRLDRLVLNDDSAIVLDLKTTDSVDSQDFLKKVIGGMNYMFQAAWYVEGVEAVYKVPASFVFIGVERTPPYSMGIFEVSSDMLREGLRQTSYARRCLAQCLKENQWSAPDVSIGKLELPPWYRSPLDGATVEQHDSLDEAFAVD
jgi:exodeoxyribonuclease VIII